MGHWGTCPPWSLMHAKFSLYCGQRNRIFLATRSVLWPKICRKCDSGRGSAPDPARGAHDAPPDPLVGWGADTPPSPHTPFHSAHLVPQCSRLRRLNRRVPPDTKSWRRHCARQYSNIRYEWLKTRNIKYRCRVLLRRTTVGYDGQKDIPYAALSTLALLCVL